MLRWVAWGLLAIIALSLALAISSPRQSPGGLPVGVWSEATPIYGVSIVGVNVSGGLTAAAVDPETGFAVLGGKGYVAGVDLANRRVAWLSSVQGTVTAATLDSQGAPSAVAVSSDQGEVLVYNVSGGILAHYYTGHDDPVTRILLAGQGDSLRLAVLTEEGYLRVYRVGSPYWAEIGPYPGEGPLHSLSGVRILGLVGVKVYSSWDRWAFSSHAIAPYVIVDPSRYARIDVSVYYNASGSLSPAYAYQGEPLEGTNLTAVSTLKIWVIVEPYGVLEALSGTKYPVKANYTAVLEGLYPGVYRVAAMYDYRVVNSSTGEIVEERCYFGESDAILLGLSAVASLKVIANPVTTCNHTAPPAASLLPVMVIDTSKLPGPLGDAVSYRLVEIPAGAGIPDSVHAFMAGDGIHSSLEGARALLVLAYGKEMRVYIDYLDDSLYPVPLGGRYHEDIALQASPTAVAVSPDLSRLFIGTSGGTLHRLSWISGETRYVETNTMEVSGDDPVATILLRPWDVVIAISRAGAAQAVNETTWKPLWRGGPGYPYLRLPLEGEVIGGWSGSAVSLAVAFASGSGSPQLVIASAALWSTPELARLTVDSSVVLRTLGGGAASERLGSNSTVAAMSGGGVVAVSHFSNGTAVLYLPPGEYDLVLNASSWGTALRSVAVDGREASLEWNLYFREVLIRAYVPSGPEPGYSLVAGPLQGANVTVEPLGPAQNLSYQPSLAPVRVATGPNGTVHLTLWDGVSYSVVISKESYAEARSSLPYWGSVNASIPVYPILYSVELEVVDSQAEASGVEYPIPGSHVTFTLDERSVTFNLTGGRGTVELPAGNYTVEAEAPGYMTATSRAVVPGAPLRIALDPLAYEVTIRVYVEDTLTGLASGPLSGALVNMTLVDPPVSGVSYAGYTGSGGAVTLTVRKGVYSITVVHPYTEAYTATIEVNSTTDSRVNVEPLYSEVRISVLDAELYGKSVGVANASVALTYRDTGRSVEVEAGNGTTALMLPYGSYTIYVRAPGYEPYGPASYGVARPNQTIEVYLSPVKYEVALTLVVRDKKLHLANGPAAGALVTAKLVSPNLPVEPVSGYADSRGRLTLLLRRGVYEINVTSPYTEPASFKVAVGARLSLTYTLIPAYTRVNISIVDQETSKPVPGAVLTLVYSGVASGARLTVSAENGVLALELPPGAYTYTIAEQHYEAAQGSFTLTAGNPLALTVPLTPIRGEVVFSVYNSQANASIPLSSRPLQDALIIVEPSDPVLEAVGVGAAKALTGPDGSASLSLRAGTYKYIVVRKGYLYAGGTLEIPRQYSVKVLLKPILYNVTLYFIDPEIEGASANLRNVTLRFEEWDGVSLGPARLTLSSGESILLPVGSYTVSLTKEHYDPETITLNVTGDAIVAIPMHATRYNVVVTVYSSYDVGPLRVSGPVSGLLLRVEPLPPLKVEAEHAILDVDGTATLSLRSGAYRILLVDPSLPKPIVVAENLSITGGETLRFTIEPPTATVRIVVVDSEIPVLVRNATLNIAYEGPYGKGNATMILSGPANLSLPYGHYRITARATEYMEYTSAFKINGSKEVRVELSPIRATFKLYIVTPDGDPVDGAMVRLQYEISQLSPRPLVSVNGTVELRGGARTGKYTVIVTPPPDSPLQPVTLKLEVGLAGLSQKVVLPYKVYNVTIVLKDQLTGKTVPFPYKLKLVREGEAEPPLVQYPSEVEVKGGSVNISLSYGKYVATLSPVAQDYFVIPESIILNVNKNGQVFEITLKPRVYTVKVTVVNDRSEPVAGVLVELIDTRTNAVAASDFTGRDGTVSLKVYYGVYHIVVSHKDYRPAEEYIMVPKQTSTTLTVYPTPLTVLKRFTPLIVGVAGLIALIAVLWKIREVIVSRLSEEEEYF